MKCSWNSSCYSILRNHPVKCCRKWKSVAWDRISCEFHVKWCLHDNTPREKTSHSDTFCVNINSFDQISQRHISTLCVTYCRMISCRATIFFSGILSRKRFFSTKLWNIVAMSDSFSRKAAVFHVTHSRSDPISRATVLHTTPATVLASQYYTTYRRL